jgi:hypothetical protein
MTPLWMFAPQPPQRRKLLAAERMNRLRAALQPRDMQ